MSQNKRTRSKSGKSREQEREKKNEDEDVHEMVEMIDDFAQIISTNDLIFVCVSSKFFCIPRRKRSRKFRPSVLSMSLNGFERNRNMSCGNAGSIFDI